VLTGACATGIVFADDGPEPRAVGVRVLPREHTYEADPDASAPPADWDAQQVELFCRREVVLCGGTFNTPQLLMLSGIGPKEHLAEHGIGCRAHLPGVGKNLQDRYDVPVGGTIAGEFESLRGLGTTSRNPVAERDPGLTQGSPVRATRTRPRPRAGCTRPTAAG
jgi:choline dehydrogenase